MMAGVPPRGADLLGRLPRRLSMDLTRLLQADIRSSVGYLDSLPDPLPKSAAPTSAFHY